MESEYYKELKALADMDKNTVLESAFCEALETDSDFAIVSELKRLDLDTLRHMLTDNSIGYCLEDNRDYYDSLDEDEQAIIDKAIEVYENYGGRAIIDALLICVGREDEVLDRLADEEADAKADEEAMEEFYNSGADNDIDYESVFSKN